MKHAGIQGYNVESTSRSKQKPSPDVVRPAIHEKSRTSRSTGRSATPAAICKRRREHVTRSKSPVLACSQLGTTLTFEEFEYCRQTLIDAILRCSDLQFFYLSALLSTLIHCFRPLHQSGIGRIFHLLLAIDDSKKDDSADPRLTFEQWQATCEHIVRVDSRGFVHFASPTMKQFLRSYPIKGIDRSQFTLARACIAEIATEQGPKTVRSAEKNEQTSFSAYATQYWHRHYRTVQSTSPGLTGQAHTILQKQIARRLNLTGDQTHQRAGLEYARRFCEAAGLSVLSEKYSQLLNQDQHGAFPSYPASPPIASEGDLNAVSEAFAHVSMNEGGEESENEWVVVG